MGRRPVTKETNKKLSHAQTNKPCMICGGGGRTIGKLGNTSLNYCGYHRKYGERVLNFLINSVYGYKLTEFLKDSKQDLFMKNAPELSEPSYERLADYVTQTVHRLEEVQKWHEKTKK